MSGFFAIGIENCKKEQNVGTLWRSAHAFGAVFIFTVNKRYSYDHTDTSKAWRSIPLFHYENLNDLALHLPNDCKLIGIETDGIDLCPSFVHPDRAVYLLGSEARGLSDEARLMCSAVVKIPNAAYCLNVSVAGSIVMCDRRMKVR